MEGTGSGGGSQEPRGEGRYIYCVIEGEHDDSLGNVGVDGNEVFTISGGGFSAVVHTCPAFAYDTADQEMVESWVVSHDRVVQMASEKYGAVLPMGFDTIVMEKDGRDAARNVREWLNEDREVLKGKMDRVSGKAEYGVQIFWDPELEGTRIVRESDELLELTRKIESVSEGAAYMYRQKLEKELKDSLEKKATMHFHRFYDSIHGCVDDIRVERTKKSGETPMLANFACLGTPDQARRLGEELERIESMDGFTVRYTGPWPPYSFVTGG